MTEKDPFDEIEGILPPVGADDDCGDEEKEDRSSGYFALATDDKRELTLIPAKSWKELNEKVERCGLTVTKIIRGKEVSFCTKLVLSPK